MMRATPHRHIISLICAEHDPRHGFLLIVPIASWGSLRDLADHLDFEGATISAAHAAVALLQVACAALHLDGQCIVHGDLAARNVLVHAYDAIRPLSLHVRLADFGCVCEGRMNPLCLRPFARELHALAR